MDANVSMKSNNRRIKAFEEFKETFQLETTFYGNQPTFHHNNGSSESQIDYILTNNLNVVSFLELKCKHNDSDNLSSHDALVASIQGISIDQTDDHFLL